MSPSLNDIELFVEVARGSSFTRAGEALDMPASTISRRIAALEKSIGVRLLNRSTRKVSLTEAGAAYFARCQHIVEEARIAHEMLVDGACNPRGRLKVSMPSTLAMSLLSDALREFSLRYPEIECEYDLSVRPIDLRSDPYDVVIRVGQPPDSGVVSRRLGTLVLGLYASREYLDARGIPADPADLARHECLRSSTERGDSVWTLFAEDGREQQVRVRGRIALNQVLMLRRMGESGMGIVPLSIQDMKGGGLVRVLPDWSFAPMPMAALFPSRMMPARARVFIDFVKERLAGVDILAGGARPAHP
ncbi:LysR family transcriptional regulator [Castellaniella defragrans]|uniref:DNA-binding transcriptional LysR family regulator n=1 Tax=Castellaniella defragrans TaxID=75697 RepID=A0A7W9TRP0_CASDE|nr:LysR family transcriptional regulator [Castellaniella defragrans]KAB0615120.1 LysR family transcriptional regulator [Castellaniella defragrans]MBB6084492.1 DNA-binding transcriptional LysR family regulator [Castellaniella defragrans]